MAKTHGATTTILVTAADLQRLIRHYGPTHIPVGRAWLNGLIAEPEAVAVLPKVLGTRALNTKRR